MFWGTHIYIKYTLLTYQEGKQNSNNESFWVNLTSSRLDLHNKLTHDTMIVFFYKDGVKKETHSLLRNADGNGIIKIVYSYREIKVENSEHLNKKDVQM